MSKEVALGATLGAGALVAVQAPVNSVLSRSVGTFGAASVNFLVGTVLLLLLTFVLAGGLAGSGDPAPWYAYVIGGLAGAAYVTTALIAVRHVGAGGVTAATIAGQFAASLVLDRVGAFGLEERALSPSRVLGVALLAVGTWLMVRD